MSDCPDLDELKKYNDDACPCPPDKWSSRTKLVGAVRGRYGSGTRVEVSVCGLCGKDVTEKKWQLGMAELLKGLP